MFQIGGGNCTICGSPGTNKSTCPCNPAVINPNPAKHPLCKKGIAIKTSPKPISPKVSPPKPSPKVSSPKVSPPKPSPKVSPPKPKLIKLWNGKENIPEVEKFMAALNTIGPYDNPIEIRNYLKKHNLTSKIKLSDIDRTKLKPLILGITRNYSRLIGLGARIYEIQMVDDLKSYPILNQIFKDFYKEVQPVRKHIVLPYKAPLQLDEYIKFNTQLNEVFDILSNYPQLQKKIRVATGCIKMETEKFKNRPTPPYKASQCVGKIMTGNDGQEYEARCSKTGRCSWKLASPITVQKAITRMALPSGGLELPGPVLEAIYRHWDVLPVPKISKKGEDILINLSPALDNTKLDELWWMRGWKREPEESDDESESADDSDDNYDELDSIRFVDLPKKEQDEMLNTILLDASEIRLQVPSLDPEENTTIIGLKASNAKRGITVGDFLNTLFNYNKTQINSSYYDPEYGFGATNFEGLYILDNILIANY